MKSSRIKFPTASELLREDTFEAERLMELYTLSDYKERQIARLRQEERELTQIINEQQEIISSYGATFDPNSETSSDALPQVVLRDTVIDVSRPNSARLPYEKEERQKIAPSGSASNLLDELQQALSNQPIREGHGMNLSHQNHSFAQSRQNFFTVPLISVVLNNLEETTDFNHFFSQFPMTLILISGFYDNNFPIDTIINSIENWPPQRRQNFFISLFHDMQRCSTFMNAIFDISNELTLFSLINSIEKKLPKLFNSKRVLFLFYDSPNEELVLSKEKVKIRFPVKQGIFQRSLITQSPVEANIEDPDVTPSDKAIIAQNKQILIIPVLSVRSQFHVEGLLLFFDKLDGTQRSDYFTTSIIARCLALIIPFLRTMEESNQRKNAFQKSVDTFVFLCTSFGLKTLIENITESFVKYFNCEAVKIFKVCNKSKTYKEISSSTNQKKTTEDDDYPFNFGIVGSCISNCNSVNLTKPQFAENYNTEVDCYDENSFSSSLLVTTILNEDKVCKWAIALYNKKDRCSFTPLDEESLATICHHLLPLLQNSWQEKKMKQAINQSKRQLTQAEALIDTIASLKNPTDIESMLIQMEKFFKSNTQFSNISLYKLDKFRKELVNFKTSPMEVVLLDSDSPIAECARTGKMIERENYVDNSVMIFYPILNSKSSVIGVFTLRSGSSSSFDAMGNFSTNCLLGNTSNLSLNINLNNFSSSNSNNQAPPSLTTSLNSLNVNYDSEDFNHSILAGGNTSKTSLISGSSGTSSNNNNNNNYNANDSILMQTSSNSSNVNLTNNSGNSSNNFNLNIHLNSQASGNNNSKENAPEIGSNPSNPINNSILTNNSMNVFNVNSEMHSNSSANVFNILNANSKYNLSNNFLLNNRKFNLNSRKNNPLANGGIVNLSTTCLDVNNNDDNDYNTPSKEDSKVLNSGRKINIKNSQLSFLTLNTFKSSTRMLPVQQEESSQIEFAEDETEEDNENALRMMKLWQKVSGSVLEAMQKHLFYSKRKQLIDHMSIAFFDNLFENSFRVWQEVQCLVDDFQDLEITDANIESPVITDLVFANTAELSEKTIQLIKTLQSLNAIDQSIFTPQKTAKKKNSISEMTVLEEETHNPSFLATSAIDICAMDEGKIIQNVVSALNELAALQFLGITENEARDFVIELRSIHPPNQFTNWKLAVDHFQFAAFMMLNTSFGKSMSDIEMISTLLFLLSLYSDPPSMINDEREEIIPMKRTRFTLETSGMFSTLSSFFTAYAWCQVHIFKTLPQEDQINIWNTIDELEFSGTQDSFIGAPPALLLCCLARKSYMMRETGVTIRWFNKKIEEEMPAEILDEIDEIKKFQLDYESEAIMNPMMEEAIKLDPNINSLLERYQSNCKSIIGKKTL